MRAKRLITVAVAAMLLIGGVAAVGAASPTDQANDNAADAHEGNAPEDVDDERADEERAGNADGVGPNDGLPEQVPGHVSGIHDRIESFLSGSLDTLGESLNDLLGNGEAADENADNAGDEGQGAEHPRDDGAGSDT